MGAVNRTRLIPAAAIALAVIVAGCGSHAAPTATTATTATTAATATTATPAARPAPVQVRIAVAPTDVLRRIPRSFLGISTEYWTIPFWAAHPELLARVFGQLAGDGPVYLRIGGDSADRSFWSPRKELPEWIFELTHDWLGRTAAVIRATGARVILDLNVVTATPASAAGWARTALSRLPRGSIVGFEIGNEPDLYGQGFWRYLTSGGQGSRALPKRITAASYAQTFRAFDRALERVDRVPLLAPALAEPATNYPWISTLLAGQHHDLVGISVHRYPYSACVPRRSRKYPTVDRVLSAHASAGIAQSVRAAVRIAGRAGLPLRLTELNSVTCGGTHGVSDVFATALWAPDALFELVRAGVASASIHVRARAINMAFEITAHGVITHPLLYGMILFSRTLAPGSELVATRVSTRRHPQLRVWAVRLPDGRLHVLLINKGRAPLTVGVAAPARGAATVERLEAPSVRATSGVTLAGRQLNAQGLWSGPLVVQRVAPAGGVYALAVPGFSAALVTLPAR